MLILRVPRIPLAGLQVPSGLDYEEVSFTSRTDQILLKGWLIDSYTDKAVVFIHGGYQNRVDDNVDTLGLAGELAEKGYDILLFDLRGRGASAGRARTLTNADRDIGGAVDFLAARGYGQRQVALLGFCSGAVAALTYAAGADTGALILDGCFPSLEGMVIRQAAERSIPAPLVKIFVPGLKAALKCLYQFDIVDPIDMIPAVRCPVFFIHEERDEVVSWEETERLFKAAGGTRNVIWQVPEAEHSQGFRMAPEEFVARIGRFLDQALEN